MVAAADKFERDIMLALMIALAATTEVPATQNAPATDDPIICKRENAGSEVGTHMRPKKVCMRKSDRDFLEKQAQRTLGNINNNGNGRVQFVPTPR